MAQRSYSVVRHRFPVAVCLAGLSPAVVTETLYALAVVRRPRIIPRRVCIITTLDAYPTVAGALLGDGGAIARLKREYRLPPDTLACGPDDVVLLRSASEAYMKTKRRNLPSPPYLLARRLSRELSNSERGAP